MNNNSENNNNSSFNSQNNKHEITFWKVIHNQYLFNHIISYIPVIVDQVLDRNLRIDYKSFSIGGKNKFKYIHSLNWMITNGQLQLLKCKLQANEYIQIDRLSIVSLFKPTTTRQQQSSQQPAQQQIETNKKRKQDHIVEITVPSSTIVTLSNTSASITTLYKEILQLLLYNKRIQIECIVDDLISLAIDNDNLDAVRILSNQIVPIEIHSTSVTSLKGKDNQIKNQIIDILVNSNSFKSTQQSVTTLILQLKDNSVLITTSAGPSPNSNSKCIKVKHDYDYRYILGFGESSYGTSDEDIYDYCCSQLNGNALEYLINKGAKLIHSRRELDSSILNTDAKTIANNQDSILKWIKLASSQSIITFCEDDDQFALQLFNIICKFSTISKHWYEAAILSINDQFKPKMEYFPTWNSELHLFVPIDTIYEGDKHVKIEIKSTATIDWMVSGYTETNLVITSLKDYSKLNFKTYQLVDYFKPYFKRLEIINGSKLYSTSYRKAIRTCNLQVIKELDSRDDINFISVYISQKDLYKLFKNNPIENVEQLLVHWYSNNYKSFRCGKNSKVFKFQYLMERVIYEQRNSTIISSGDVSGIEVLKRIKLNLNGYFQNVANEVVISLIKINDLKSLSLILGLHQFKFEDKFYSMFKESWNNGKQVHKYLYDKELNVYRIDDVSVSQIVSAVQFWICHLKLSNNNNNNSGELIEINDNVQGTIPVILNHLFSTFIQIRGVTIQELMSVRQLILNNSIEIYHSTFHSFNYLFIKSPLITKYLIRANLFPMLNIKPILDEEDEDEEGEDQILNNGGENGQHVVETNTLKPKKPENNLYYNYNCKKHRKCTFLRSNNFTVDSIFCSDTNVGCILFNLVSKYTHFERADGSIILNANLEVTVDFLIEIGRVDILLQVFQSTNVICHNLTNFVNDPKLSIKQLELVFKSTTDLELVKAFFNVSKLSNYVLWFKACLVFENLQIVNYLFGSDHFNKSLFWGTIFSGKYENYNLISLEYIFSNFGDKLFGTKTNTDAVITNSVNNNNNNHSNDHLSVFNHAFVNGNVLLCDLLLKYFPNQFQISNGLISKAQKLNKFNIISYYQNGNNQ